MLRAASKDDLQQLKELWNICFHDSPVFQNWFFQYRVIPEWSFLLEEDGIIKSCLHTYPYQVNIRGKEIPAAMICGVCTHPDYRKKGLMGQVFRFAMQQLYQKNRWVAPLTPVTPGLYDSFGAFVVSDATYLTFTNKIKVEKIDTSIAPICDIEQLYPIYQAFAQKYNGIILRTPNDFSLKMEDYQQDNGKIIGSISSICYCVYYETVDTIDVPEFVAISQEGTDQLLLALEKISCSRKIVVKAPPATIAHCANWDKKRIAKSVMAPIHIPMLLKQLELSFSFLVEIRDDIIAENNGIWDCHGNKQDHKPAFSISSGHFLQLLLGYLSFEEAVPFLELYDTKIAEEAKAVFSGKEKDFCYIIDEY